MAVWVVRGGRHGEREEEALENGMLTIGFDSMNDLSGVISPAAVAREVTREVQGNNPSATPNQISAWVGQVWSFIDGIEIGDLIVMPRKGRPIIAVGQMTGDYIYRPGRAGLTHGRAVEWINREVSRARLERDLKRSLSANMTVFQPRAPNSESRLRTIAAEDQP